MTTNLDQRAADPAPTTAPTAAGATVWLTGLPSAGKSTIAHALAAELAAAGTRVQVLDGDEVRPYLSTELGFSKDHRDLNVTRIGYVARLLAGHGVVVLVPVIAPYAATRDRVRADHTSHGVRYAEVHVATSLAVAESRDVKGLYAKARSGELTGLTGLDDPYEAPADPDLVIDTAEVDLDASVRLGRSLVESLTAVAAAPSPGTDDDDKESR
ncbi:adenylyl-sulfate kinase [Microlunatus speluncae]|uniref:adenylyl-sulfate kinase n=1 Tax=Microlunatus speluncae TaxID=2594267 RepID=UPI0012665D06|nr:adenylyl-sulfate kinase [Microlunatus speluncae]